MEFGDILLGMSIIGGDALMLNEQIDWGRCEIILGDYLLQKGISKNKIAAAANLQRSQLISYCKNEVQRPDLAVLARICCVLRCDLSCILRYSPPVAYPPKNTFPDESEGSGLHVR